MQAAVEKIPAVETKTETEESVTFTQEELAHFIEEINRQFASGSGINLGRALRNARYLTKLDESNRQFKEGKVVSFTAEEWEKFTNEQAV
ncbi:MAG: hypothetical protein J5809_05510 [Selenomonadaceae bacterium]|nr:hypothetical protein [Selenomonadaceae bacterium]